MFLKLENKTNNKISIKLFPKKEYSHIDMYRFSDGSNGYRDTKFEIAPNQFAYLYNTGNIDQEPFELASEIFDSIYITTYIEDEIIMKFYHDSVLGYSDNLFNKSSHWNNEVYIDSYPTNFSQNPVEVHDYTFIIVNE